MKLKSVKILGDNFRSLAANKLYEFNSSIRTDKLSTKIFAGLNGSGKSNFLELFSEIFYFLEIYHLETVPKSEKANKGFGFEIEYFLPTSKVLKNKTKTQKVHFNMHVRIVKPLGEVPEFSKKDYGKQEFERVDFDTDLLLPTKVIAYTSGQNELLSNPYYKLKYHYFKTFELSKKYSDKKSLLENHRLFFLDYNTNFSIFVANLMLADKGKVDMLKDVLRIDDLQSFRITINTDELYKKVIPVSETLSQNITKLKLCATAWIERKVGPYNLLVLDYLVTRETKKAFAFHFKKAFDLFKVFYELEIFNLYLVNKKTRDLMLQVHKTFNLSDELPKHDPSRLVFRIEKIFISKILSASQPSKNIYYKALSDGEHQFNEVIGTILMMEEEGCMFLIDEPDTHFNPMWRSKLIKMLNYMAALSFDSRGNIKEVRQQEIILTTHSPFVISDSTTDDVYRFKKVNGIIDYDNPKEQMFGASISVILDEIFEKEETISEMAKKELLDMAKGVRSLSGLQKIINRLNTEFGDSVEKFDLFSKLMMIKTRLQEKVKK
ncbi:restriction system-associated AAA family ATPase [Pedobacter sp. AK013]|uniref:restriction system-associated AAA family ATPase n=1 Tax=Pedobacter sp. AK013 TaxID=2723071 RepID=UPI0016180A76|nr:restriction system-associated AAA family ATPase [Pedobacter sp. AK013]MBB6240552.1 restriction system-associated AAA family ATPase [Pedobacter sp. AK013]